MRQGFRGIALVVGALALLPPTAGAATINVTTENDELGGIPGTGCALREAVQAARDNAAFGGCAAGRAAPKVDTILLEAATYTLDLGDQLNPTDENLNQTGDLDFGGGDVVVRGEGRGSTTVTQVLNDRIFDASPAATLTLTLEALTVEGGNTTFELPDAADRGGNVRLRSGGHLVVRNARVTGGAAQRGAGIYASGGDADDSLRIINSTIDDNSAQAFGGGLHAIETIVVQIKRSTFDANHVSGSGSQLLGGGIDNLTSSFGGDGSMTITDSVISENEVINVLESGNAVGGGIRSRGPLTVQRSLIRGNLAGSLGDLDPPQNGGGIWQEAGTARVVNSTIYDNAAGNSAADTGMGGGIYASAGAMKVNNVTFLLNDAGEDGGDSLATGSGGGDGITFGRSIIPGTAIFGDPCAVGTLPLVSSGLNAAVSNDLDCRFIASDTTTGALGTDPGGPQDNGGPTPTIAITPEGTAFDKVPGDRCGPAGGVDQRGYPRPASGRCDAGAFELQSCGGRPATVTGTNGADILLGTSGVDVIAGLGGKDKIKGRGENDRLCGGRGKDALSGGGGSDRCVGGPGRDTAKGCETKTSI